MKKSVIFFVAIAMSLLSYVEGFGQSGPIGPQANHIHVRVKLDRAPSPEGYCPGYVDDNNGDLYTFVPVEITVDEIIPMTPQERSDLADCFAHWSIMVFENDYFGEGATYLGEIPLPDPNTAVAGAIDFAGSDNPCLIQKVYPMDVPVIVDGSCFDLGPELIQKDLFIMIGEEENGSYNLFSSNAYVECNNFRFTVDCQSSGDQHGVYVSDYEFCCPEGAPIHSGGGGGIGGLTPAGPRGDESVANDITVDPKLTVNVNNNPFQDLLEVKINSNMVEGDEANLQIFDLHGKQVWSNKINITEERITLPIDLSHLANGMYILSVEQNKIYLTEKIVKF